MALLFQEKKTAAKDSLFGGNDSPEDDLFGSMTAKPRADSARKKPVGGVALFGGQDLFGKKDKPSEEPAAPKEKPVIKGLLVCLLHYISISLFSKHGLAYVPVIKNSFKTSHHLTIFK